MTLPITTRAVDELLRLLSDSRLVICGWCGRAPRLTAYAEVMMFDGFSVRVACVPCWPSTWTGRRGPGAVGQLVRFAIIQVHGKAILLAGNLGDALVDALVDPFPVPPAPRALPPIAPPRARGRRLPPEPAGQIRVWLA